MSLHYFSTLCHIGPRTPKSLRRCWSNLDLPKSPIPEGVPMETGDIKRKPKKPLGRSGNAVILPCQVTHCCHDNCCKPSMIPTTRAYSPKRRRWNITYRGNVARSMTRNEACLVSPFEHEVNVSCSLSKLVLVTKTDLFKCSKRSVQARQH